VEPTREKRYKRRIAQLEAENATLKKKVAELKAQVGKLTEQIAKLSKNSSNSSKPPSSDIVKPPKGKKSKKRRHQGGQPGHPGVTRQPFTREQINDTQELHAKVCGCGCRRRGKNLDQVRIHQFAELRDDPLIVPARLRFAQPQPKRNRNEFITKYSSIL